ncbi:hypothetical protein CHCC20491_1802 [Bacillus paralicheniformis]|nr:hypothetical protein CHCC20491_1802 [Bacillus paralicheniformis]
MTKCIDCSLFWCLTLFSSFFYLLLKMVAIIDQEQLNTGACWNR